jgi:hypothetical protein
MWGCLKSTVYGQQPHSMHEIKANISTEFATIKPNILEQT